jgi:hypothetical protein
MGRLKSENCNFQRRNLTSGQRALVAVEIRGLEEQKGGRPGNDTIGIVSNKSLAKQFHTSLRDLTAARDLLEGAPNLAEMVTSRCHCRAARQRAARREKAIIRQSSRAAVATKTCLDSLLVGATGRAVTTAPAHFISTLSVYEHSFVSSRVFVEFIFVEHIDDEQVNA